MKQIKVHWIIIVIKIHTNIFLTRVLIQKGTFWTKNFVIVNMHHGSMWIHSDRGNAEPKRTALFSPKKTIKNAMYCFHVFLYQYMKRQSGFLQLHSLTLNAHKGLKSPRRSWFEKAVISVPPEVLLCCRLLMQIERCDGVERCIQHPPSPPPSATWFHVGLRSGGHGRETSTSASSATSRWDSLLQSLFKQEEEEVLSFSGTLTTRSRLFFM